MKAEDRHKTNLGDTQWVAIDKFHIANKNGFIFKFHVYTKEKNLDISDHVSEVKGTG